MAGVVVAVPVNKRIVEWHDGLPVLTAQPVLSKEHVRSLYQIAAAQPYIVDDPLDPDFGLYDGMTIAEVLVRKEIQGAIKSGDVALIETVMDRLIGKPETHSKSLNVSVKGNYEDYLKDLAAKGKPPEGVVETSLADEDGDLLEDLA